MMVNEPVSVRLNFEMREIAISGPQEQVKYWFEQFAEIVVRFENFHPTAKQSEVGATFDQHVSQLAQPKELPPEFGEYFHHFPLDVTDVDRALVAAFFAQSKSDDNSFSTRDVGELLLQQGVRLTNPSVSVKRNVEQRRAFGLGNGRFRISQTGTHYLVALETGRAPNT